MMLRAPFLPAPRWLRSLLASALFGLPLYASCTPSEDTEPYVPASEGAVQPSGDAAVLSEDDACERIAAAEDDARGRLRCGSQKRAECPSYIRPAGGSGCYEYSKASVEGCEAAYADARTCTFAPCIVVAVENTALPTCALLGMGGMNAGAGGNGVDGVGGNETGTGGTGTVVGGAAGSNSDPGAGGGGAGSASGGAGGA